MRKYWSMFSIMATHLCQESDWVGWSQEGPSWRKPLLLRFSHSLHECDIYALKWIWQFWKSHNISLALQQVKSPRCVCNNVYDLISALSTHSNLKILTSVQRCLKHCMPGTSICMLSYDYQVCACLLSLCNSSCILDFFKSTKGSFAAG